MPAAQIASNKATSTRFPDAVNSGDTELISKTIYEVFDPDVRLGGPLPIDATGAQALKQTWAILLRAYPDLHITVEDLITEGDKLVARNTVTGTRQSQYLSVPPTGKSVTYNEIFMVVDVPHR
jgi:SnoaL-like polyketide cyclase